MKRVAAVFCVLICVTFTLLGCIKQSPPAYSVTAECAVFFAGEEGYMAKCTQLTELKILDNGIHGYQKYTIFIEITPMYLELAGRRLRYFYGEKSGVLYWELERNRYTLSIATDAVPSLFTVQDENGTKTEFVFEEWIIIDWERLLTLTLSMFSDDITRLKEEGVLPNFQIKHLEQLGSLYFFCGLYDGTGLKRALIADHDYQYLSMI